jgi:diguanylate cyclase (GGDEF)-like protein
VRTGDTLARLGGDEFAVILERLTLQEEATAVAERIVSLAAQPFVIDGRVVAVTASVGVVLRERDTEQAGELLRRADLAMYAAKAQGKSRYVSLSGGPDRAWDHQDRPPWPFPAVAGVG